MSRSHHFIGIIALVLLLISGFFDFTYSLAASVAAALVLFAYAVAGLMKENEAEKQGDKRPR